MRLLFTIGLAIVGAAAGCGTSGSQTVAASSVTEASGDYRASSSTTTPSEAGCAEPAMILEAGRERGPVCPDAAAARGLTIVDLRDGWTPRLFAVQSDGSAPTY